jgi:hypothetical protein
LVSCVGRCGITQSSSRITSTPATGSGLARASSPTSPTRAAGRRRRGSPPRPPDRPRWGQALVESPTRRLPLLWPPPQPPPPAATPWPRPCLGMATGNSPSGNDHPSPSPRGEKILALVPVNVGGGHFYTIPDPVRGICPRGVPVPTKEKCSHQQRAM